MSQKVLITAAIVKSSNAIWESSFLGACKLGGTSISCWLEGIRTSLCPQPQVVEFSSSLRIPSTPREPRRPSETSVKLLIKL